MAFIAARRARQASNGADAAASQHGSTQHHQRSDNTHTADATPAIARRDDWSVVFPGRAATVAAQAPASQQSSDEEERSGGGGGGYTLTMPPLHDGTGRFTAGTVRSTQQPRNSSDEEEDDDDDIYFNPPSAASLQQWDATSLASRSDSELASSLSPLPSASDSNLDDEDLISSLLLPSDSSLSRDARSDDAAARREVSAPRAIEGATLRRREPRGASNQAVWSWASTSAGAATGASSLHDWSSSLADMTVRPEADEDELEMDLATGQRTPGAVQRRRAAQEEEEEDAFNTLLSSAPMAYSAGLGGLRNAASITEAGEAGSAARRAIKRRHRRAGGSARSKRSRSATETSASVSVARGVPRESAASRAQLQQRSGAATPTTSEPAVHEQDTEAARQSKSHRLLRAVLSRLLGASESDEAVLDALLLDAGPLAVTEAEAATHTARLERARAAPRGFAHEQADVLGSEVPSDATSQNGTVSPRDGVRTRLLIDGREVEDIEEEIEAESTGDATAPPASPAASTASLPASLIKRDAPFEPTTLEALQAALAESGLQLSNLARVPVPLRLLGQLARALGVRAWTAYSANAAATRFGKALEDDSESDDEVLHEPRAPLGQQVPSAWRGTVHPALRARSISGVSTASID